MPTSSRPETQGAQTLLTSPSGALPPGAGAYLACGGTTTARETQAESAASVGVPCTPSPELSASFAGFNEREVTLDEHNAACSGDVCLVNHFQGPTTCPYGQDKDGRPVAPESACTVPGTGAPVRPKHVPLRERRGEHERRRRVLHVPFRICVHASRPGGAGRRPPGRRVLHPERHGLQPQHRLFAVRPEHEQLPVKCSMGNHRSSSRTTGATEATGSSSIDMWPRPRRRKSSAPGMRARNSSPYLGKITWSRSPQSTSVGT
jgi:hypothetical protein